MTRQQLEEAKVETRGDIYLSLADVGLRGAMVLLDNLLPYSIEDEKDPSFFEQLLGDKGIHKVMIGSGIGLAGVGTVLCISNLSKLGTIRSALNINFQSFNSLVLAPAVLIERGSHSLYPGLTLTCSF